MDTQQQGTIFNIQRYSLHDGPGIRTVVFLKGCPLTCRWCSNPESQSYASELAYNCSKCIGDKGCDLCRQSCLQQAIRTGSDGIIAVSRKDCKACFQCVAVCPSKALHTLGRKVTVQEVLNAVETDSMFYSRSGGGLTLSGGEPLSQPQFALALLREAKRRRIHATVETCGFVEWEHLAQAAQQLKTIFFDIKCIDEGKHLLHTGVSNERITQNFLMLRREFPSLEIVVRTPVIPGFNDSTADISAILEFIQGANVEYELLPYHRMGKQKYEFLDRQYAIEQPALPDEIYQSLQQLVAKRTA